MWILLRRLMISERILRCEFSSGKSSDLCQKESFWTQNQTLSSASAENRNWGQKGHSGFAGHPSMCVMRHKLELLTSMEHLAEENPLKPAIPGCWDRSVSPDSPGRGGTVKWSLNLLWDIQCLTVVIPQLCRWMWQGRGTFPGEHSQRNISRRTFPEHFTAVL